MPQLSGGLKRLFLFFFILLGIYTVRGQQKPQITQYIYNTYLLNPAITGIEDYTDLRLGFRDQWTGIPEAPKTFFFTIQSPLGNKNHQQTPTSFPVQPQGITNEEEFEKMSPHHGLGFQALADKSGPFTQLNLDITYAYHVPLSNHTSLSAGFGAGIYQLGLNANQLVQAQGQPSDPALVSFQKIFPDLNLGLWLYSHRYFLGVSLTNSIPYTLNPGSLVSPGSSSKNYFLTAGYKIYVSRTFSLLPSFLWKYVGPNPSSLDLNLKANYLDRVWLGLSLRSHDSFSVLAGVNINPHYNIGYSYDYTTSSLASFAGGTHEIFIGFLLNNTNRHLCPRNVW